MENFPHATQTGTRYSSTAGPTTARTDIPIDDATDTPRTAENITPEVHEALQQPRSTLNP